MTTQIYLSHELPFTFINLDEWKIIYVNGNDSKNYLQSKITIDITKLNINDHALTAHCNAKGQIIAILNLFHYKDGFAYLIRKNIVDFQVNELKKYSIFSKVNIAIENHIKIIGISGYKSRQILRKIFNFLPNHKKSMIVDDKKNVILFFHAPIERFIVLTKVQNFHKIYLELSKYTNLNYNNNQWLILDIESKFPVIDIQIKERFIPQDVNLHLIGAIDFKKGCYSGQEIIAKTYYLGITKRFLCLLTGHTHIIPKIGSYIELKISSNNWIRYGVILSFVKLNNTSIYIQAVIKTSVKNNDIFKITGDEKSLLKINSNISYNKK